MDGLRIEIAAALPSGFRVGHWMNDAATSGCTAILPPAGNVSAYDARGNAPGSRELACLDVQRARTEVHAIMLTGGSAYGLATADGAMRWLEERGIGFRAGPVVVPIVPAAVIFDRAAGDAAARPDAASGYAACDAAAEGPFSQGRVGAGAGATAGKWAGLEFGVTSGLASARASIGEGEAVSAATAIVVANPAGDVIDAGGSVVAGSRNPSPHFAVLPQGRSTILALLAFEATMTKTEAAFLAARGSDGITVSVRPAHTRYDGDVVFAVAGPPADPHAKTPSIDVLGVLATAAVAAAVRAAAASGGAATT